MVGSANRPTTRSQSKANASRLNNNNTSDSKLGNFNGFLKIYFSSRILATDIATKLNNLPEKTAQATAELNQSKLLINLKFFLI